MENNSLATVLAVVLACILTLTTAIVIIIVICIFFKKSKRKPCEQLPDMPEHIYESVSWPPSAHLSLSEATDDDYVDVKATSDAWLELTKNSCFKPPSAAETMYPKY
jgi:hypothetical protein